MNAIKKVQNSCVISQVPAQLIRCVGIGDDAGMCASITFNKLIGIFCDNELEFH